MNTKILGTKMKLYDLAVILMMTQVMLDRITYIEGDKIGKVLTVASLGLFMVVILLENTYTLIQLFVIGVVSVIALYSSRQMGEYFLLTSVILAIASLRKEHERTIIIIHTVKLVFVMVSVVWYTLFELIGGEETLTLLSGEHIDHKFGFTNPNIFALTVTWMIFERVYLYYDKIRPIHIVGVALAGPVLFYLTACDTAMYVLFLAAILLVLDRVKYWDKVLFFASKFSFAGFALFNYFCVYYYANQSLRLQSFLMNLDDLLSARIREVAQIYSMQGTTAFGQSVDIGGEVAYDTYYRITTLICDGLYSYLLVCLGYVNTIILAIMIYYTAKQRRKRDCMFILIYTLYAMMENHGLNAFLAFPILIYQTNFFNYFNKAGESGKKKKQVVANNQERLESSL